MLNSPQDPLKKQEIVTAEISVQVDDIPYIRKTINKPTHFRKLDFLPESSSKKPEPLQLLTTPKANNKRSSAFNNLHSKVQLEKDFHNEKTKRSSKNSHLTVPRCKSGELKLQKEFDSAREAKKNVAKRMEVVYSTPKIKKNPSAFQLPPVFDPLGNFVNTNSLLFPCKEKSKPRIFKNYQTSQSKKINANKKVTGECLTTRRVAKQKYYFRHLPKFLSVKPN